MFSHSAKVASYIENVYLRTLKEDANIGCEISLLLFVQFVSMFTKIQEEYLIRRLNRNEVVLFLGAGFSFDAKNQLDENFPVGKGLSKKIWEYMFPSEPFVDDQTSLQDIYQALLKSGKSFDQIKIFLNSVLTVKTYPEYYKYITIPFWYKIYTVNIDNLLDKVYQRFGEQNIDNLIFLRTEFKERDQLLDSLQVIYLHGKLPCKPDEVIFSRAQYASSSIKLQPLYFHFVHDYANLPTIFIGTSLDEQLFEQYIATRQSIRNDIPENRPKSFLITKSISKIRERVLKDDYNIEVIRASSEEFLEWIKNISPKLLSKEDLIRRMMPTLDKLLEHPRFKTHFTRSIKEFSQSFQKIELNKQYPPKKKDYLLGTTPRWSDIHYALDAPRKITGTIFQSIEYLFEGDNNIHCLAILGTAGSGKSTVLKRLCYNLLNAGRTVYFSHSENLPRINDFIEALEMINSRVIIAIDNAELVLKQLVKLAEELNKIKYPPIFLLASRRNMFDRVSSKYDPIINLKEFEMPNLDRDEIIDVIGKLDENNVLGYLKGLNQSQRIKEFENRAKKQILVAMREATKGEDFEVIMKSEFDEIKNEEGKLLCTCVSLTTEAGFTISRQDFTSFSSKPPAEALDILNKNLKGLILKVGDKEERLFLRHRTIADFFIERCATPEMVKQAYIRVLSSLASEINTSSVLNRKFSLYIEIINHYMIYKRFSKNINMAREVYESLIDYFRNDYHFWLQYGSLELEGKGGNLDLADNYLNQAFSLKPQSGFVKNALAHLFYKKALVASSKIEADRLKGDADDILIEQMKDKKINDPYTYHIFGKGCYHWILKWQVGLENIRKSLSELDKILKEGCELYPSNRRLKELKEVVFKAILLTTVVGEEVTFPILYSDFDK